jgi:hypothetical protein
MYIFFI